MDLVVTVPKERWLEWIEEGDAVGAPPSGVEWGFYVSRKPDIQEGDRLYIVAWGRLRGYAPVTGVQRAGHQWAILRRGGAVAVTIPAETKGFRGFQKPWWRREEEVPFEKWRTAGVPEVELTKMAARFEVGKQRARMLAAYSAEHAGKRAQLPGVALERAQYEVAPQFWPTFVEAFEKRARRLAGSTTEGTSA